MLNKTNEFRISYNDGPIVDDRLMTRKRASTLLRSWRRVLRQPANDKIITGVVRVVPHTYRVTTNIGISETIYIGV